MQATTTGLSCSALSEPQLADVSVKHQFQLTVVLHLYKNSVHALYHLAGGFAHRLQ